MLFSDDSGIISGVDKAASEDTENDEISDSRNKRQKGIWRKANSSTEAGPTGDREVKLTATSDKMLTLI